MKGYEKGFPQNQDRKKSNFESEGWTKANLHNRPGFQPDQTTHLSQANLPTGSEPEQRLVETNFTTTATWTWRPFKQ